MQIPRPHTAGNTAKAAANAMALANALKENHDLSTALSKWEAQQPREGLEMTNWGVDRGIGSSVSLARRRVNGG